MRLSGRKLQKLRKRLFEVALIPQAEQFLHFVHYFPLSRYDTCLGGERFCFVESRFCLHSPYLSLCMFQALRYTSCAIFSTFPALTSFPIISRVTLIPMPRCAAIASSS